MLTKVGDKVRITILSDGNITKATMKINGKLISQAVTHRDPDDVNSLPVATAVVLDKLGKRNAPLYNGRVVCVDAPSGLCWKRGGLYTFENGVCKHLTNYSGHYPTVRNAPIACFDDLQDRLNALSVKMLEVVE